MNSKDCKLYCASQKSCCGCIKICNVTCQWNALTDCERLWNSGLHCKQCVSEKPGTSIRQSSLIITLSLAPALFNYNTCSLILIVCFDIQLIIDGETDKDNSKFYDGNATVKWQLGACTSSNSIEGGTAYKHQTTYTERCCLEPGRHTLVCYNDPPSRGWKDAYIMINGQRYCDDFISYISFQKILVTGKICSAY